MLNTMRISKTRSEHIENRSYFHVNAHCEIYSSTHLYPEDLANRTNGFDFGEVQTYSDNILESIQKIENVVGKIDIPYSIVSFKSLFDIFAPQGYLQ